MVEELSENRGAASEIVYTGFLAQEVENAAENINFNFSGVKKPKSQFDTYGLSYAEFTIPLVKAVQEQQLEIQALQNTVNTLLEQIESLKLAVNEMNPR